MTDLVTQLRGGSRRALARLLTLVENESEGASEALAALFPQTGHAWIIGVTGAPGTGKSSLVNALAKAYRAQDKTVGIVAVDPTSPFTGGAILGDRIRMRDLSGDSGVFIRSMATRGSLGGLARATRDALRLLDAAGFDIVIAETVGAGQSEVDIVRTAHTTVVVEAPGLGDDVQAIKAGILEIADVLVVNKADRPGANNTERALKAMLELGHPTRRATMTAHHGRMMQVDAPPAPAALDDWLPPVVRTIATDSGGIDELVNAIARHRDYLQEHDLIGDMERQRIEFELQDRLRGALVLRLMDAVPATQIETILNRILNRELYPQQAVMEIIDLWNMTAG